MVASDGAGWPSSVTDADYESGISLGSLSKLSCDGLAEREVVATELIWTGHGSIRAQTRRTS